MSRQPGSADSPPRVLDSLLNDQSQRWKRGERLPVEAYLERQPEMGGDADQILDLVYHEILLRAAPGRSAATRRISPALPGPECRAARPVRGPPGALARLGAAEHE